MLLMLPAQIQRFVLPAVMQTVHTAHCAAMRQGLLLGTSGTKQVLDVPVPSSAHTPDSSARRLLQVIRVIRHILRERRWWHLPRYTFGSSSGGVIALELPLRFPFQARRGSLSCLR